jgi:hypothetical protein
MNKLLVLLEKLKGLLNAAYDHAPFAMGVSIGYFCAPEIKLLMNLMFEGLYRVIR